MFKVGDLVKIKKEYWEKDDKDTDVYTIDKVDFGKDKEILITRTSKQMLRKEVLGIMKK